MDGLVSAHAERGGEGCGVEDGLGNVEAVGLGVPECGDTAVGVLVVVLVGVTVCVELTLGLLVLVLLEVKDGEPDGVGVTVVVGLALLLLLLLPLGVTDAVAVTLALPLLGVRDAVPDALALLLVLVVTLGATEGVGDFVGLGDGEGSGSRCPGTHPASTTVGQAPSTQFQTPYNVLSTHELSPVHAILQWPFKVGWVQNMLVLVQEWPPVHSTDAPSCKMNEALPDAAEQLCGVAQLSVVLASGGAVGQP